VSHSAAAQQLASPLAAAVLGLMAGAVYRARRGDLPDWHSERFAGNVNDEFILTENDELIEE